MSGKYFRHWRDVPEWLWELCPNFHPSTDHMLVSPDTGALYFDIESFQSLQLYRDKAGPTNVLSGWRSEVYNARKGGSVNSFHYVKIAFDLRLYPHSIWHAEKMARASGFTGIGLYPTRGFIHVDLGPLRSWFGSRKDKAFYNNPPPEVDLVI